MRIANRTLGIITAIVMLVVALVAVGSFSRSANGGQSFYSELNGFVLDGSQTHGIVLGKIVPSSTRDSAPAISQPVFISQNAAEMPGNTQGILVQQKGEKRFYPFNILAWHEVVNDRFGDLAVAVTYFPASSTAAVYDRQVDGRTAWFGTSGLTYESNSLLYDDQTQSLWLQPQGRSIVGLQGDKVLRRLPFQVLDFANVKKAHPTATVLAKNTGYSRDYSSDPYALYYTSSDLIFDVSVSDQRLSDKTMMYIVPISGQSVAFELSALLPGATAKRVFFGKSLVVHKDKFGQVTASIDGALQPGYTQLWFAWAALNPNGEFWDLNL